MYLPYFKIEIIMSHKLTTSLSFEQLGPTVSTTTFSEENECPIIQKTVIVLNGRNVKLSHFIQIAPNLWDQFK